MARTLYAGRPGDTVAALFNIGERLVYALPADANGDPTSVTLTVWDEPDGTQLTDLLAADGVTPITAVVVPPGSVQIPAFYGPDSVNSELWLRDPEGDYTRLDLGPPGGPGADGEVSTAQLNAAIETRQPLDPDLTAIAALTTTSFGRAFLALADAAATRAAIEAAASTGGGREKTAALSATTGTATGNLNNASIFTVTPTGNITLAFSNVPAAGTACTVTVIVSQGGTVRTVTPPSGTKWMGAAAPTQVANKACAFTFLTVNGGTTWYASAAVES